LLENRSLLVKNEQIVYLTPLSALQHACQKGLWPRHGRILNTTTETVTANPLKTLNQIALFLFLKHTGIYTLLTETSVITSETLLGGSRLPDFILLPNHLL